MTVGELQSVLLGYDDNATVEIGLVERYQGRPHSPTNHSGRMDCYSHLEISDTSDPSQYIILKTEVLNSDPYYRRRRRNAIPPDSFASDLRQILNACVGTDYAHCLIHDDQFFNDVKANVEETSAWYDEGFYTDDDIRLAIGRVLLAQLGIDHD